MDLSLVNLINWLGPFVAGVFGVGVGYATLREQLKSIRTEFSIEIRAMRADLNAYRESNAAAVASALTVSIEKSEAIKERVAKVEHKNDEQVGYVRCKDMREECSSRIIVQLSDLSRQVSENRNVVVNWMQSVDKILGRVEQYLINEQAR